MDCRWEGAPYLRERMGFSPKNTCQSNSLLVTLFLVIFALATHTGAELRDELPLQSSAHWASGDEPLNESPSNWMQHLVHANEILVGEAKLISLENGPLVSLLQESASPDPAAGSAGLTYSTTSEQMPDYQRGTAVLRGVNITVTPVMIQGTKVIQVAAFKGGNAVAVFNLTSTSAEKMKMLNQLSDLALHPEALFDLTWEASSPTSGKLRLKLESTYIASASKPTITFNFTFKHVVGRKQSSETVTASIPKENVMDFKDFAEFKTWLAANSHPPVLRTGESFEIIAMRLVGNRKKVNTVKGESQALEWLQQLAARAEPILSVSGDAERKASIEVPYHKEMTWPMLLRIRDLVEEGTKAQTSMNSLAGTIPGLKIESFTVQPSWFALTPQQQYELWQKQKQAGITGVPLSERLGAAKLFGPQYVTKSPPFFFFDSNGRPLGTNKHKDQIYLVGSRDTPILNVPDYVAGMLAPAINARLVFPGGTSVMHLISALRDWDKIEKGYADLRAALAPKEPEKNGALLSVSVNGQVYPLVAEFVMKFPTLLHLLSHLSSENSEFVLNDVTLTFGASVPRSVKSIFVLETPQGLEPWCTFQFDIPITKRNTIVIKSLFKKARRAAESTQGCNITNARGLRFETITAVAKVTQLQPVLLTTDRQQLNFKGTAPECKRLGSIFTEAHKRGQQLALFFTATHLLRASVEIPKIDRKGGESKSIIKKNVSARVHMNEDLPHLLLDFKNTFAKNKVPTVEYPYMHIQGGPKRSALQEGLLPESWYHQTPGKVKIVWQPEFPVFGERDSFTDGNGPHPTKEEVNIPIRPGVAALSGPFSVIQRWLKQHIPKLDLPVDLENMPAEDRNSLFSKIIVEVEGGEKMNLMDILKPMLRTPNWKTFKPEDYKVPYHFLTLPIKNMFIQGGLEFIVTTPEGSQHSHTIPVRPGESWGEAAESFFHKYPQYDRTKTKLSLFDSDGNPVVIPADSSVYVGVKEAVEQRRKGLQVSLETPFGKFTACYRQDVENNKCMVVSMHTVFCGKIKGISDRAERWEKQCNSADMRSTSVDEVQRFMEETLRGADLVRPVRLRDLLTIVRKMVATSRPDVLSQLNLPDSAASQAQITKLKAQMDALRAKKRKTAEDYDAILALKRQVKLILSRETKWATLSALNFFYVVDKGAEKELSVPIQNTELRLSDEAWKAYHHATRMSPEAAALDFAHVFDFTFRVLGMEERREEKNRMKMKAKLDKQAEKAATQVKLKVKVEFDVENEESFSDSGVEVLLPMDFATGLTIGGKRSVVSQLSKIYNIPKSYFTYEGYPRVITDSSQAGLPILKVALQAVCLRKDGTIGVSPKEMARVLTERGGYSEGDLIFLITASGEKLRVSVENARQIAPEKARQFMFAWKRTQSDIATENQEKEKEKIKGAAGEVADPSRWKELLGPWLSRLRGFGPLSDTKIQFVIRNDKETNKAYRNSKCQVNTFGDLLEYINVMDQLVKICPGLQKVLSNRQSFAFDLGIRAPPPSSFRVWNRGHGDPERNRRYLERLTLAFSKVLDDSEAKVEWKFGKHSGRMSPDQIGIVRKLLQSDKPRDAALVREILAILKVPAEDIARLTGRLNITIAHEPTEQDKLLLREGLITLDIARADSARILRSVSAQGNPTSPVDVKLPQGEYSISYSLYSPTQQVSGSPCGIRNEKDFDRLTWGELLKWCNLNFQDMKSLAAPFLWIEGIQMAMYPQSQPGTPVVSYQSEVPLGFTYLRPGTPVSGVLPSDLYYNLVQQPGMNVPGATYTQRIPTPSGKITTDMSYFGNNPQRWGSALDQGTRTPPRGTTAELNFFSDQEQEESGKAFTNPIRQVFEFPGFSRMPSLQENFNVFFNPSKPIVQGSELVYVQAPPGNGRYYYCPGITLAEFVHLKKKEDVAKLCSIPLELLDGDLLVSSFSPGSTPNYSPAQPSVPVIVVDRLQTPHHYTARWEDSPSGYIDPFLQGGHADDQVAIMFANENRCVLTRPMLRSLKSWLELVRFCSASFEGRRPTDIVAVVMVRIFVPENLRDSISKKHNGISLESLFSLEPLGQVINNILSGQAPGVTLVTTLEMNDGTKLNFTQIPENWRSVPAPQIPGLASISIKQVPKPTGQFGDTNMGTLRDLLTSLHMDGNTPFSKFVTKFNESSTGPTGVQIPATNIHIGGPADPGAARPHFQFEMVQPESIGGDGKPLFFGTRAPLAHGAVPDDLPMDTVIQVLHNPTITVITALAGSNVPLSRETQHLNADFKDVTEWLKSKLGIDNASNIHCTMVVDGIPYRGTLTAAQLLGHTLESAFALAGTVDLEDSHSIVIIGQPAPGHHAKTVQPSQQLAVYSFLDSLLAPVHALVEQTFMVNGEVYNDRPGTPMDLGQTLNIHVPGQGQAPMDFKFNISGPAGETVTQLVPADLMRVLQEVADQHGSPGLSLVLSFLNSLKQVRQVAPGRVIKIDTQHPSESINALLESPVEAVPQGSYLMVFTGSGPHVKKVTVPITPQDRGKTISHLLQHLNIVLQTISDLRVVAHPRGDIQVEDGSVDLGLLGKTFKIPVNTISSKDTSSIEALLKSMGQQLGTMLASAKIPNQKVTLHTIFTTNDGSSFAVDTPLGNTENVEEMLSKLTLWSLVPEEAQHKHIRHVSMRIQVEAFAGKNAGQESTASVKQESEKLLLTEQSWGTLPGVPASSIPGFFIQLSNGNRVALGDVAQQSVRVFLRSLTAKQRAWSRVFWGVQTDKEGCIPKTEFPYYMVMSTTLESLAVPKGKNCLIMILLDAKFQEKIPNIKPDAFEVSYLYHEPPLQAVTPQGRNVYFTSNMDVAGIKKPLRKLLDKAIGWKGAINSYSCLISNPNVPFACEDPLPVDIEKDTLETVLSHSRYVVISTKSKPATQMTSGTVKKASFLARIQKEE